MSGQNDTHIIIVGAGPIGIEMAVALKRMNIDYLQFDAKQVGHTISWWPRDTTFFSTTERIEISGIPLQNLKQQRTTGEEYLAYLRGIVEQYDLHVNTFEPVIDIQRDGERFIVTTQPQTGGTRSYTADHVVLAKGDMDIPNALNIPGEDLPFVHHYFDVPHTYFRKKLLIVGGRNSAAEAALRCFRAGANVTISYRRAAFTSRIKHWLKPDLETQIEIGTIGFQPETVPVEIKPGVVRLKHTQTGEITEHETDFVLVLTGYKGDMTLFERAGIETIGPNREPAFVPETMETNVPGLYLAGTAAAGEYQGEEKYRFFIENSHEHVAKIIRHITGQTPKRLGTIPQRKYDLPLNAIDTN